MTVRELLTGLYFDGIEIRDFETNKRLLISTNKVEKYLDREVKVINIDKAKKYFDCEVKDYDYDILENETAFTEYYLLKIFI